MKKINKALVLVDLENEWRDKDSDYYVGDLSKLIGKINQLIDHCRDNGYKVVFIRHVENDSDGAFAEGSENTELFDELHRDEDDVVVTKHAISAFYQTDLEKVLDDVDEIMVGGILTNLCVRSLVSDAYDRGFGTTIVEDCCVAMDQVTHEFTLKDLKDTREEIDIVELEELTK